MTLQTLPPRGWHAAYIGAPYRDHGDSPEGWDCFGLVWWCRAHVYGDRGLDRELARRAPDPAALSRPDRLAAHAAAFDAGMGAGGWMVCERKPGAAVLFNIAGRPVHVGLMLHDGGFLHVDRNTPTCVERLDSPQWARRVGGFYVPA